MPFTLSLSLILGDYDNIIQTWPSSVSPFYAIPPPPSPLQGEINIGHSSLRLLPQGFPHSFLYLWEGHPFILHRLVT